jgi:hypothetical protein
MASSSSNQYPVVEQPSDFKVQLFPHQLTSIYHMEEREKNEHIWISSTAKFKSRIGILGDIPGYGKSMSILGLIARDKMSWKEGESTDICKIDSNKNCLYMVTQYTKSFRISTNLIVVSQSILHQWVDYIRLTPLTHYVVDSNKSLENIDVKKYDIILVIPTFFNKFHSMHSNYMYKRFIYDEPVNNVIPSMGTIQAGYYWLLTATYEYIGPTYANNRRITHFMHELCSPFFISMIKFFVVKNTDEYVRSSFVMPNTHNFTYKCIQPNTYNAIKQHVSPVVLNMINAGNIKGAIESLGGTSTNGNLIDIVITKQKEKLDHALYMKSLYEKRIKLAVTNNTEPEQANVSAHAMWSKKVDEHNANIQEMKQKYSTMLEEDCPVCAETMSNPILVPCCQHIFCGGCIVEWVKNKGSCITCRSPLTLKQLVVVNDKDKDNGSSSKAPIIQAPEPNMLYTKQDMVIRLISDIISKNKDAKIILFSEFDQTFDMIKSVLQSSHIVFKECKGTSKTRENVLKNFRVGNVPILFLNANYNGAGINLQETTDIILYHEMNDSIKTQIIGRANRLGRTSELNVHTLIY